MGFFKYYFIQIKYLIRLSAYITLYNNVDLKKLDNERKLIVIQNGIDFTQHISKGRIANNANIEVKLNAFSFQFIVQITLFNFNFDVGNFIFWSSIVAFLLQ